MVHLTSKMRLFFGFFSVLPLLIGACAANLVNPYPSQAPDSSLRVSDVIELKRANRIRWSRRDQRESLTAFLASQRAIVNSTARRESDFVLMSRAEYLLAEYFSAEENEKLRHFGEAAHWAEMALLENPDYKKALNNADPLTGISLLRRKNAEALFWHAIGLSRWAEQSGVGTALRYRNRIERMMARVNELRPNYYFAGVHRFFGIQFATQPGWSEDDLALSKKHFEQALRAAPDFFGNHVSFAAIYGKKIENAGLTKKHLEVAARGEPGSLPGFRPEQILEQRRARKLLEGVAP
jgi:hypothetical protein